MSSVDDRIVAMKFDNRTFEAAVATTIASLENLKKTLSFNGAPNSFADISAAAKNVDMSVLAGSVDQIAGRFSAMGAVAFSVISNITTRALDASINLAKMFTIAPTSSGFSEYELKLGAIQTIMAGSGESLEVVNQRLADLNAYSDKTIYSFKDMTSNIGKFTNAGVDLDTAVASIQGIANVAALSGANAEEASRAMYNFAQSLSSGSVKLMDWKSIELANMATVEFKTELLDAAVSAGTLTKGVDGMYTTLEGTPVTATKGFNESLEQQWLSADVLTNTLQKYSDTTTDIGKRATDAAQDVKTFSQMMDTLRESAGSGWAATSEILFGNFDEAKALFTGMNNAIGGFLSRNAEARNEMLGGWKKLGGRTVLIEGIVNIFQALGDVIKPINDAFRQFFPKMTSDRLYELTVRFRDFTEKLKLGGINLFYIKKIFTGIFAAVKIGTSIIGGIVSVFTRLFKSIAGFAGDGQGVLAFFAGLADKVTAFQSDLASGNGITTFFESISSAIDKVVKRIAQFVGAFKVGLEGMNLPKADGFYGFFNDLGFAVGQFWDKIKAFDFSKLLIPFKILWSGLKAIGNGLSAVFNEIKSAFGIFGNASSPLSKLREDVSGLTENVTDLAKSVGKKGGSGASGGFDYLGRVGKRIGSIFSTIGMVIKTAGLGFAEMAKIIGKALSSIWNKLSEVFDAKSFSGLLDGVNTGLFAGLVLIIKKFLDGGLLNILGGKDIGKSISGMFNGVTGALNAMQTSIKADALTKIAGALALLTVSIVVLSLIDGAALAKSLVGIGAGLVMLTLTLDDLSDIASGPAGASKLLVMAGAIAVLAGAMLLLGGALKVFADVDPLAMALGLGAMKLSLDGVVSAMESIAKVDKTKVISASIGLFAMVAALGKMADVVVQLSELDPAELAKGMAGVAGVLALLTQAVRNLPTGSDNKIKGMFIFSLSLKVLASVVEDFAAMPWSDLLHGLLGMGAAMGVLTLVVRNMKADDMAGIGLAMAGMALGLSAMAIALKVISTISLPDLIKSIGALLILLPGLAIGMEMMSGATVGASSLAIAAGGLYLLAKALQEFAKMSLGEVGLSLLAIAGVIAAFVAAAVVVAPVLPLLVALGGALLLIGAGFALLGAGAMMAAKAFEIVSKGGEKGVKLFKQFLDVVVKMVPEFIAGLADGFMMLLETIIEMAPKLIEGFVGVLIDLLKGFRKILPELGKTIGEVIDTILQLIVDKGPDILLAGFDFLINFLKGIAENIGEITNTVVDIITGFLAALTERAGELVTAGLNFLLALLSGISDNMDRVIAGALEFLTAFVTSLIGALDDIGGLIVELVIGIGAAILNNASELTSSAVGLVVQFMAAMLSDLSVLATGVVNFFVELASVLVENISELNDAAVSIITGILQAMIDGIGTITLKVIELIVAIATAIVNSTTTMAIQGARIVVAIFDGIVQATGAIASGVGEFLLGMLNALTTAITTYGPQIRVAGSSLAYAIGNEMVKLAPSIAMSFVRGVVNAIPGLGGVSSDLKNGLLQELNTSTEAVRAGQQLVGGVIRGAREEGDIQSPSRVMMEVGRFLVQGLVSGITQSETDAIESGRSVIDATIGTFNDALSKLPENLAGMKDFELVITPVLDMSKVEQGAGRLDSMMSGHQIATDISYKQASRISTNSLVAGEIEKILPTQPAIKEVRYEQNIYAPSQLSMSEIYRQTKTQLSLAKEELVAA